MTLSNISHLVYITLYVETDGVILSRLDCIHFKLFLYMMGMAMVVKNFDDPIWYQGHLNWHRNFDKGIANLI